MENYKKKYEEAMLRMNKWVEGSEIINPKEVAEFVFPELKESEDERIRKELIEALKQLDKEKCPVDSYDYLGWVVWLEKQGEQKPTRPVWKYKKDHTPLLRDSFILNKYGCVAKSPSGALVSDVWVLDFDELAKLPKEEFERQSEQQPTDKVEPKFKVGDVMRTLQEAADGFTDGMPVVVSIDDTYYRCTNEIIDIKNQDNYEYPPINRRQNTAWSEDDEETLSTVIEKGDLKPSEIQWLKSLKERVGNFDDGYKVGFSAAKYNQWKPSDEQMETLEHFVRSVGESGYASPYDNNTKLLYSLLYDLKKLRKD